MKTHHKIGILATIAIVAIILGFGATGAFLVIHHFQVEKSKTTETVKTIDSVALQKGKGSTDSSNIGDQVKVQATGYNPSNAPSQTDDMISYDPKGYHAVLHSQSEVNQFLLTHRGVIGIVHVVAKHANGVEYMNYFSTNSREVGGLSCILSLGFAPYGPNLVNNGTNFNQNCGGNGTSPSTWAGPNPTSSTHWGGFNVIALFNRTSGSVQAAATNGTDTASTDATYGVLCGCTAAHKGGRAGTAEGLIFGSGAFSSAASTGIGGPSVGTVAGVVTSGNSAAQQITVTSGTFNFPQLRASGTTITGVALLNATKTPATIFAENGFSPVTVASTDTLTITWTISIS